MTQNHQIHAPPERDEAGQAGAAAAGTDGTDAAGGESVGADTGAAVDASMLDEVETRAATPAGRPATEVGDTTLRGAPPRVTAVVDAVRSTLDALNAPLRRLSPGARRAIGLAAVATIGAAVLAGALKPLLLWNLDPFARLRGAARAVRVEAGEH